jgi:hypothetical protein
VHEVGGAVEWVDEPGGVVRQLGDGLQIRRLLAHEAVRLWSSSASASIIIIILIIIIITTITITPTTFPALTGKFFRRDEMMMPLAYLVSSSLRIPFHRRHYHHDLIITTPALTGKFFRRDEMMMSSACLSTSVTRSTAWGWSAGPHNPRGMRLPATLTSGRCGVL